MAHEFPTFVVAGSAPANPAYVEMVVRRRNFNAGRTCVFRRIDLSRPLYRNKHRICNHIVSSETTIDPSRCSRVGGGAAQAAERRRQFCGIDAVVCPSFVADLEGKRDVAEGRSDGRNAGRIVAPGAGGAAAGGGLLPSPAALRRSRGTNAVAAPASGKREAPAARSHCSQTEKGSFTLLVSYAARRRDQWRQGMQRVGA